MPQNPVPAAGIEIVEADKIGLAAGADARWLPIQTRRNHWCNRAERRHRRKTWPETCSRKSCPPRVTFQSRCVAGAVRATAARGSTARKTSRIRSLPALHRLMQNTRLPVNQFRMQGERIAAEHDMALRPILRNSGMPGSWRVPDAGHARAQTKTPNTTLQQQL